MQSHVIRTGESSGPAANCRVLGLDIGGAHLKFAVADAGQLTAVDVIATPVWRDPDCIVDALRTVTSRWPGAVRHAITMTAELADAFATRSDGVEQIVDRAETVLAHHSETVYLNDAACLVSARDACQHPTEVASANWLALPTLLAQTTTPGVIVDFGSTTCDFVPFTDQGAVEPQLDDLDRLRLGLLLYTGLARTPICAVTRQVTFKGKQHGVADYWFATMADAWRVTGQCPDNADLLDPPDGGAKTPAASRQRLARMLCTDADAHAIDDWIDLAHELVSIQKNQIADALDRVIDERLRAAESVSDPQHAGQKPITMIGAGVGRFVLADLAVQSDVSYRDCGELLTCNTNLQSPAGDHAPAASLALLATIHE